MGFNFIYWTSYYVYEWLIVYDGLSLIKMWKKGEILRQVELDWRYNSVNGWMGFTGLTKCNIILYKTVISLKPIFH